jgi:hypothetical protein
MALTSPGVEVTIIDQSQYLPAPTSSVPLILLATAQNKADASGTGVAQATTLANANKLYQITSQRDLVNLYGTPFFYSTTAGTPIQGYELNEYGLLAAYSTLGVTNRAYILRCAIDLASLVGQTGRPTANPDNGTYWLDSTTSTWGIFEFNATTAKFVEQIPIVISDVDNLVGGVVSGAPLQSIGNIGEYAVKAVQITTSPALLGSQEFFYKTPSNDWTQIGTASWKSSWATIQGTNTPTTLTAGNTFVLSMNGYYNITITVPASSSNTVAGVAAVINALAYNNLSASVSSGKLQIKSKQFQGAGATENNMYIQVVSGTGTVLADLGITVGTYYQPEIVWGTSSEMPLWSASQTYPHPTGSVWMKVGSAGSGLNPVVSKFNSTTASWVTKSVTKSTADWTTAYDIDSTGGQAIPAGSIYAQYSFNDQFDQSPVYLWERLATGPTVVTSSLTTYAFAAQTYTLYVQTSVPGSSALSSVYTVTVPVSATAATFVTAWAAQAILYTQASVNTAGSIVLTHTEGGEIILNDFSTSTGVSNGVIALAGFAVGTNDGCKFGPSISTTFSVTPTGGTGSSIGTISVIAAYKSYNVNETTFGAAGTGYTVGDVLTVVGANLGGTTPTNNLTVKVTQVSGAGAVLGITYNTGTPESLYSTQLSNWVEFTYETNEGQPNVAPANNTNWFYSVTDQVDIMVNYNGAWKGYKNQNYDANGFPTPTGSNTTDPAGPLVSATAPTLQSDSTALVYGDLWIDTSDLEMYPVIKRWQLVDAVDQWVLIDSTDQVSSDGVLFADARWALNGTTNPYNDPIPTIVSLLTSDYLDLDAPNDANYPVGMLLFNTRRSGYNVKQFKVDYFNNTDFAGETLPTETDAWVTVSGLRSDGSPYMGRSAQRAMVVQSLRSAIDTNTDIRDEDNFFNLMATPNYPELQPNMVVLNADRGETGYILGDTPLGLADSATEIQAWATNAAGATSTGEAGCVTRNTYLGLFYPSGIANDLSGNEVVVPASHMMMRTFLRNDTNAYPWLAAAGTRRGTIDNALNIGYLNRDTGEFQAIKTRLGIRDVLYINFINPMVFFTGVGLLNYGNKTSFNSSSALDRTNVARLVAYIRRQLTLAARPFVFEPNDALTRQQIAGVVESLMIDLVAKRGLYDYLVVCDDSNNTPARIDRNELWIDVAVEPVKAAEFIYIPVRILNTGELSGV